MENITELLHAGNFSCVINSGGITRTFTQRGVADLYDLLKADDDFLQGASVADKVVGKGAAALMAQGGVKEVYADLISEPAYALLVKAAIKVEYRKIVHHIENRDKTDWCPLEKSCKEEDRVSEILPIVDHFIAKIRSRSFAVAVLFAVVCGSMSAREVVKDLCVVISS